MQTNATRLPDVYLAGDDAARKLVVLRLVLERLVDDLGDVERLVAIDDAADRAELRDKLGAAIMLACVALDEVEPLGNRG